MQSSFLASGSVTREGHLASLHLSRDQQISVKLSTVVSKAEDQGYAEGVVTNTRFGSFPHSTLIGIPWGSQVLASKVDTGSRGRSDLSQSRKRKANAISTDTPVDGAPSPSQKDITVATSGFIHVLPPTPESWTTSLPHRTQVVYTPDYSFILQKIRARPGSTLIEAGSGSGSFTHAAARAVFHEESTSSKVESNSTKCDFAGKVYTFEYHAERHEKVKTEMLEHNLDQIVTAFHRDVYKDGFWLKSEDGKLLSPRADCVFLDLPAPWEALQHITREETNEKPSVLDRACAAYICTFSPCIEQVERTVSEMRKQGWVEIETVEIRHKRIDVKREYTGLKFEGMRGVNAVAATVDEALSRLQDVEERARDHHDENIRAGRAKQFTQTNSQQSAGQIHWNDGRLIHRAEPELKTHTSYLVFAILPKEWTEEDELKALAATSQPLSDSSPLPKSQKQIKREAKLKKESSTGELHQAPDAAVPEDDVDSL